MTSARTVFVGTPAFLARIDGVTRCAFWTCEPVEHDFDPARLISVDLARSPSAAAAKEITWADVDVDDCFSGPGGDTGGSTLGPAWPELHLTGAVYLATAFVDRLPPALMPTGFAGEPYERQSVVYWPDTDDPRAGNRYAGHCAEVLDQRGTLARVAVFRPGSVAGHDVAGPRLTGALRRRPGQPHHARRRRHPGRPVLDNWPPLLMKEHHLTQLHTTPLVGAGD